MKINHLAFDIAVQELLSIRKKFVLSNGKDYSDWAWNACLNETLREFGNLYQMEIEQIKSDEGALKFRVNESLFPEFSKWLTKFGAVVKERESKVYNHPIADCIIERTQAFDMVCKVFDELQEQEIREVQNGG